MSGSAIFDMGGGIMSMLAPSTPVLFLFGASGAVPVFRFGRWWTVLSAGWLHASLLHIFMNMYWVRQMGPAMTEILGPARTVIIYTAGGVAGFALSSFAGAFLPPIPFLHGAGFTVGASAPVFGSDRRALSLRPHQQQHRQADGAVDCHSGRDLRRVDGQLPASTTSRTSAVSPAATSRRRFSIR